jgi:hypothetical protein
MCVLTFNNKKNSYPIQGLLHLYVLKYQKTYILTRTIHKIKKFAKWHTCR